MKTLAIALGFALTLPVAVSSAQPRRELRQDNRELRQDNRELRQDKAAAMDDLRDARRYQILLGQFDQAVAARNAGALAGVEARVLAAITGEINESNREMVQKGNEAARSQNEVGRSRNEVVRDNMRGQPVRAADDRRDLRDDRRDARDDRRDAARETNENNRLRAMHAEYSGLLNRLDPPAVGRKRQILVDLNLIAQKEIRDNRKEIQEDRREKREDIRERREDRRQGGFAPGPGPR